MKIVIMGSGHVAYHLTKAFRKKNIAVEQIFGRNKAALASISAELSVPWSTAEVAQADLYILAVSDGAVAQVSSLITAENCLVAHTSGSLSKEILIGNYRKASFYPLQTFSKTKNIVYDKIPFFVETEYPNDQQLLLQLAKQISENVMVSTYEKRKYIHLTAVFACNFVNHLFARAKEISDAQEIPFDYFFPLIQETTEKITQLEPKLAQTGPAVRKDERILQLHEDLITDENQRKIYRVMNESIKKMYEL